MEILAAIASIANSFVELFRGCCPCRNQQESTDRPEGNSNTAQANPTITGQNTSPGFATKTNGDHSTSRREFCFDRRWRKTRKDPTHLVRNTIVLPQHDVNSPTTTDGPAPSSIRKAITNQPSAPYSSTIDNFELEIEIENPGRSRNAGKTTIDGPLPDSARKPTTTEPSAPSTSTTKPSALTRNTIEPSAPPSSTTETLAPEAKIISTKTKTIFHIISNGLGHDEWRMLGRYLGFDTKDLDELERYEILHITGGTDKFYKMLENWYKKENPGEQMVPILVKHLEQIGRKDIADLIKK